MKVHGAYAPIVDLLESDDEVAKAQTPGKKKRQCDAENDESGGEGTPSIHSNSSMALTVGQSPAGKPAPKAANKGKAKAKGGKAGAWQDLESEINGVVSASDIALDEIKAKAKDLVGVAAKCMEHLK